MSAPRGPVDTTTPGNAVARLSDAIKVIIPAAPADVRHKIIAAVRDSDWLEQQVQLRTGGKT